MLHHRSLLASLALVAAAGTAVGAERTPPSRTFQVVYTAMVKDVPAGAKSLDLWLPYPQTDENQVVHSVRVTAPGPVTIGREPQRGNEAVYFHQDDPKDPVTLRLEIDATRNENSGHPAVLTPVEKAEYLAPEPLVPLDGPVKAVADEATRGKKSDADKAHAIYERVTSMMKYDKSGTGWGRGDAIWACDAKRGNCTDFHALIIGAARSQGIPARFAIGLPVPEKRGSGEIPGYHCWAELYVRGRWLPVDSSEGSKALARGDTAKKEYFYGRHDENRLEFSRGRQVRLLPAQKGAPLNFFIYPYAEVDGKPFDGVERKFGYADVGPGA
jgi:transglutaminase-like putative cysteine protease